MISGGPPSGQNEQLYKNCARRKISNGLHPKSRMPLHELVNHSDFLRTTQACVEGATKRCTVRHKNNDPPFHKKYMEAGVINFVAYCTFPVIFSIFERDTNVPKFKYLSVVLVVTN